MRRLFQRKSASENGRQRAKSIALSWPVLIILALALGCTVVWSFVMGFLVGRGHNPEDHLRELTGFQASASEQPENMVIDEKPAPAALASESEKIVAPRFPEPSEAALGAWGEGNTGKTPPKNEKPEAAPKNAKNSAPAKVSESQKALKTAKTDKPATEQFDYIFQLAAFRQAADATRLKSKIKFSAIRVEARKSGKVHLVLASFRGTAKTAQDYLAKLQAVVPGKPLMLSRKAVPVANAGKAKGKK